MKRLIPIATKHLMQTVLLVVFLALWLCYEHNNSLSSEMGIWIMLAISSFNLPNVDLLLQFSVTRKTIFHYLALLSFISSLICTIAIWLTIYRLNASINHLGVTMLIFFVSNLFVICACYLQYAFHKLPGYLTNGISILLFVLAVAVIIAVVFLIKIENIMVLTVLLLAIVEIICLYFLVKRVDITVAMRKIGK